MGEMIGERRELEESLIYFKLNPKVKWKSIAKQYLLLVLF